MYCIVTTYKRRFSFGEELSSPKKKCKAWNISPPTRHLDGTTDLLSKLRPVLKTLQLRASPARRNADSGRNYPPTSAEFVHSLEGETQAWRPILRMVQAPFRRFSDHMFTDCAESSPFFRQFSVFCRAGHFRYFVIFSIIKMIFCTFYQVNNLFLHQSYLKSPLPVKLTW